MGHIIAVTNYKGGVGKTTSTINIAAHLAKKKNKVLVIDLDPQANLSHGFGIDDDLEKNVYTIFRGEYTVKDSIITKSKIDIVPSTLDLSVADAEFNTRTMREFMLKKILAPVKDDYDFILIDCPPNLALLTINAIVAADFYVIPLQAEFFALKGLAKLVNAVKMIKDETQSNIELAGIFLTRFNQRKTLSKDVLSFVQESMGDKIYECYVRENVAIAEAQSMGISIFDYDKQTEKVSNGAEDYRELTEEILKKIKKVIS